MFEVDVVVEEEKEKEKKEYSSGLGLLCLYTCPISHSTCDIINAAYPRT